MNKSDKFLFVLGKDCVYTGISRQTNAETPITGAIMIANTVLAALAGLSCGKRMIWFP